MEKQAFRPLEISNNRSSSRFLTGFTLVELMIAFSIFSILIGLVLASMVGLFRSFQRGERMLDRDQKQRFCLYRLSKEVASLTKIIAPNVSLAGDENSFFLYSPEKIT